MIQRKVLDVKQFKVTNVTSTYMEVPLQALLDNTVERLFLVQKSVIYLLQENELDKFCL